MRSLPTLRLCDFQILGFLLGWMEGYGLGLAKNYSTDWILKWKGILDIDYTLIWVQHVRTASDYMWPYRLSTRALKEAVIPKWLSFPPFFSSQQLVPTWFPPLSAKMSFLLLDLWFHSYRELLVRKWPLFCNFKRLGHWEVKGFKHRPSGLWDQLSPLPRLSLLCFFYFS